MSWIEAEPPVTQIGAVGWARVLWRGLMLGSVTFGGLIILLLIRLIEAPKHGMRRPWTPHITRFVCRMAFPILGIEYKVTGLPMTQIGAVVANHGSWLDIFALNACQSVYFVSKAEVARWPFIGWLARSTGTVFIRRARSEAKAQQKIFEERIRAGHHLLFFPEGTSTDARRVLPFKPTLFEAFFSHGLDRIMQIQPVTVIYRPPEGEDPRFYGWWGDMAFGPHLLKVLAQKHQGGVEVVFHRPVNVSDFDSRKGLAAAAESAVRAGLPYEIARAR
ncbi:acyl-phosphate glycerol 3-phosphate acyltransferase [Thioclava dalianensis]|uniref:Acyl-phosphate glycerol 3-phosphate acyltransferase n=1 Tax=Thioclava dalianensis TaxID=1185766 RepID=A0A074TIC1_9RHOB|nr:lysophospholipid acyltransferase family protein [Thioclava dalianensis]KEP71471.1 acyl-phosphate glycerol 3-phosphate acyltransferase [Thioclava dalianensis]SFN63582.1 1-acyl-sn-glycerol-3-phosphate acyltransferase [Thioclava dalianensis]